MGLFSAASLKANRSGLQVQHPDEIPGPPRPASQDPSRIYWSISPDLENAIDTLWVKLRRHSGNNLSQSHRTFIVTHWEPDEGATMLAAALALGAAQLAPACTFCVGDFDFDNPGLSLLTGMEARSGLSNVLAGQIPLDHALASTRLPNLYVGPSGHSRTGRRVTHLYEQCRSVCEQLSGRFNCVFLDLPLLRDHPDSAFWASELAEALLVVRAGQARKQVG